MYKLSFVKKRIKCLELLFIDSKYTMTCLILRTEYLALIVCKIVISYLVERSSCKRLF
jgi:hypothetical protein